MKQNLLILLVVAGITAVLVMACGKDGGPREEMPPAGGQQISGETDPPENQDLDEQPRPVKQVSPGYPEEARQQKIEGTVFVKALVGKDGSVRKTEVATSDHEILDTSALRAIEQWEFSPAMKDGAPVAAWVTVPVKFKLE